MSFAIKLELLTMNQPVPVFLTREAAHGESGGIFLPFLVVVFTAILIAGIAGFHLLTFGTPWSASFYESVAPTVAWVSEPLGIGAESVPVRIRVEDDGGGIDEVIVRISQRNQPQQLFKRSFERTAPQVEEIEFSIDPKNLVLREGKAELEVLAFDRTMWSNTTRVVLPLAVDFAKPRIEVITPQQNSVEGGVELVFFKVVGKAPIRYGIEVLRGGSSLGFFPGFQARSWDKSFKSYEDVFFAFFPVALGYQDDDVYRLSVRDDIGNVAIANFNYQVKKRRFSSPPTSIDPVKATEIVSHLKSAADRLSVQIPLSGEVAKDLGALVKGMKTHDEAALSDVLTSSAPEKRWTASFGRPLLSLPSSTFGERRQFSVDGVLAVDLPSSGTRFGASSRQPVLAANVGKVTFVGELGAYGTTVVIDHGLGLTTVYAHLSSAACTVGETVQLGQPIGKTGTSGFALGEEVLYETRMHGVPVSPNEWWDSTWIADHLDKKISFVQGTLIGNPGE